MNFLAHAYLSFKDPDILTGNMISDFVKGKTKFNYSEAIQKGIMLHRAIDEFTDRHEATAMAKQFFKPAYGLYASAFIDISYDHFLANDVKIFETKEKLSLFASETFRLLDPYISVFPAHFKLMFPYMKAENWLYNYHTPEGIFKSYGGLVRRATYMSDARPAMKILLDHYESLKSCYEAFFPDLAGFASHQFLELKRTD